MGYGSVGYDVEGYAIEWCFTVRFGIVLHGITGYGIARCVVVWHGIAG